MESLEVLQDICQTDWKFSAGQIKNLQDRHKIMFVTKFVLCEGLHNICQTDLKFLLVKLKICQFCQTVQQFLLRLRAIRLGDDAG